MNQPQQMFLTEGDEITGVANLSNVSFAQPIEDGKRTRLYLMGCGSVDIGVEWDTYVKWLKQIIADDLKMQAQWEESRLQGSMKIVQEAVRGQHG